ncbi:murein L,D-transpeptidase catalytic domain family protein [Carboxylicivirga taeanensis]|uniref:murein L,D-transpeptidase catalytic domain family protein n=1 Tax=Carboxylicivirga taeanensis TaxID=1416875 RepID=UPI003F6DBC3F
MTFLIFFLSLKGWAGEPVKPVDKTVEPVNSTFSIYQELSNADLRPEVFEQAYQGWLQLKDSIKFGKNIISVVDFSKPSTEKRFFVIDIDKQTIIYQNYVAHGKNSGLLNAEKFSNVANSLQSSLGYFKTGETYYGKHGLSLKLDGLQKGINDLARERHIVIHKASYAEEAFIKQHGRLGRSFGCPAIPSANYQYVIDAIKNGTLLFIYHPKLSSVKSTSIFS